MSAVAKRTWTTTEYLTMERASEEKHEYLDGEIYLMSGASRNHNRVMANTLASLHNQLRQSPCEVFPSDMRVKVTDTGLYTYPDISVVYGEPELEDTSLDTLLNPTLIIEVLSPATESYDRGRKFQHYRALPSLQEYVLISQEAAHIEPHVRQPNDAWLLSDAAGLEATLDLSSIGCRLALADVYEKVSFETE